MLGAIGYITDPRNLKREREGTKSGRREAKKTNWNVRASKTVSRRISGKYELLQRAALKIIKVKSELFAEYGEKFLFYTVNFTRLLEKVEKNRRVKVRCRLEAKMQ